LRATAAGGSNFLSTCFSSSKQHTLNKNISNPAAATAAVSQSNRIRQQKRDECRLHKKIKERERGKNCAAAAAAM
jgi:hypothetical protein